MSNETATGDIPMQDVTSRIESALYDSIEEPETTDGEEVVEDALEEELPETDDSDSDDEEGSDLDDIAEEEELTLASYLGIDEDRIVETEDGYAFNAIIDGETKPVPLKELAASYQLQGHVNNKSIALENERKEFDEARVQVHEELKTRVEGLSKLSEYLENGLVGEYNNVDWDKLQVSDPAQWAALRQEYAERAQEIQKVQGLVSEEKTRFAEEQQKTYQENFHKHMTTELSKMVQDNPEWADQEKMTDGVSAVRSFLAETYGYQDSEIKITDHRLMRIFQDAKAFREGKKGVETKRVAKKLPKFQKPGATRASSASLSKARTVKAKRAKVKETGSTSDVASLLLDRM